jgi:hypothetical protein
VPATSELRAEVGGVDGTVEAGATLSPGRFERGPDELQAAATTATARPVATTIALTPRPRCPNRPYRPIAMLRR